MKKLLLLVPLMACTPTVTGDLVESDGYGYCPQETRVGGFFVQPEESWTTIQGTAADGVNDIDVFDVTATGGDCELWFPRSLFCDPGCGAGEVCSVDGTCAAAASNQDIGSVELLGLAGDVQMDAIQPVNVYSFSGDLPFPAFEAGDRVDLVVDGASVAVAFGIEDLQVLDASMALESGEDARMTWTPPTVDVDSRVRVTVDIANHGGVPAKIVCEAADDGELVVPAVLVDELLSIGWSGFPSVTLVRQSADTADMNGGCMDFAVRSLVALPVEIDGLISCSDNDDCPDDLTCQQDLTCG